MTEPSPRTAAQWADRLVETIRAYGRAAVALSAGVDSTVVAKAAQLALGDHAVAVTGNSASLAAGELELARQLAAEIGIRHEVIDTGEFGDPNYVKNEGTRCYFCKSALYDQIAAARDRLGFDVICSGANLDDQGDFRPGLEAAAQRRVRHPLQEAGFTKEIVRQVARYWRLSNWDKPAAPCLASRVAVGLEVTPERAQRIDRAEATLRALGFSRMRVRYHPGDHARIEVAVEELPRLVELAVRTRVVEALKALGFKFVAVDLEGFRSGSLNVLVPEELRGPQQNFSEKAMAFTAQRH